MSSFTLTTYVCFCLCSRDGINRATASLAHSVTQAVRSHS